MKKSFVKIEAHLWRSKKNCYFFNVDILYVHSSEYFHFCSLIWSSYLPYFDFAFWHLCAHFFSFSFIRLFLFLFASFPTRKMGIFLTKIGKWIQILMNRLQLRLPITLKELHWYELVTAAATTKKAAAAIWIICSKKEKNNRKRRPNDRKIINEEKRKKRLFCM